MNGAGRQYRILLIDDEAAQRESISGFLRKKGFDVATAANGRSGLDALKATPADLVLSDYRMPDISGEEVLRAARDVAPDSPVVLMTAYGSIESAVHLMKLGAFDYLQKPIDLEELLHVIERARERSQLISENRLLREQLEEKYSFEHIISQSDEMEQVLNTAARVAPSKAPVLIRGESGTGKELIARAIHLGSDRSRKPLVVVNCAALPESLFESELFGHEKGAFTGADRQRVGKFEAADGSTLFIDEVGDIPKAIQVKLLRAIQFGEIERLGGNDILKPDVRVVSATNRNLEQMIETGDFREDLYYRLNVIPIHVPPLRRRRSDIAPLAHAFVNRFAEINGKGVKTLSREAMDALQRYDFPGNVRELENIIQRAVVLARGELLTRNDLPAHLQSARTLTESRPAVEVEIGDLNRAVENLERVMIERALVESEGNQVRAAVLLNISERTLRYKLRKFGLKGE